MTPWPTIWRTTSGVRADDARELLRRCGLDAMVRHPVANGPYDLQVRAAEEQEARELLERWLAAMGGTSLGAVAQGAGSHNQLERR